MKNAETLLELSRKAGLHYGPTPFWQAASNRIVEELQSTGIEQFRQSGSALSFFVPTYGFPGNGLSRDQLTVLRQTLRDELNGSSKQRQHLEAWLSGEAHALSDYRALSAAARSGPATRLLDFSESAVGAPAEHFVFDGKCYSRSALNYLLGLCFLAEHAPLDECRTILEIGGGFGTLGEIMARCWPKDGYRYIDLDIPPTCFFADYYLKENFNDQVQTTDEAPDSGDLKIEDLPALTILPNWFAERLQGGIDVFVNFISFQEMEPDVVTNYLNHVDRLKSKWILLRNMREGKQQRTETNPVGVETPITAEFYGQVLTNYRQIATDTTVYGFRTSDGFHSDLMLFERTNASM